MSNHSPESERVERKYFAHLKETKWLSEPPMNGIAPALGLFEECPQYRGFKAFHFGLATAFNRAS